MLFVDVLIKVTEKKKEMRNKEEINRSKTKIRSGTRDPF